MSSKRNSASTSTCADSKRLDDLPTEILCHIFEKLNYGDLAHLEQVNKKCLEVVRAINHSRHEMRLDEGMFVTPVVRKPNARIKNSELKSRLTTQTKFVKVLRQLLNKTNPNALRQLDVSFYSPLFTFRSSLNKACLRTIATKCPRLTSLNIGGFDIGSVYFKEFTSQLTELRHMNLTNSNVNDQSVLQLLRHCPHLHTLDLTKCNKLCGTCLADTPADMATSLRSLSVNDCSGIALPYVVSFLQRHGTHLTDGLHVKEIDNPPCFNTERLKYRLFYQDLARAVELHAPHVRRLSLTVNSLDDSLFLPRLVNLTDLDLSFSHVNNAAIASLLNKSTTLRSLNLKRAYGLSDEAFCTLLICAPLRHLDVSGGWQLSNAALVCIGDQLATSLTRLDLGKCSRLSGKGVVRLLDVVGPQMRSLGLSTSRLVDNEFAARVAKMAKWRPARLEIDCDRCYKLDLEKLARDDHDLELSKTVKLIDCYGEYKVVFGNRNVTFEHSLLCF